MENKESLKDKEFAKKIEENQNNGKKMNKIGATKKTIYSIGGLIILFVLIFVLSLTQAKFDKDAILTVSFWVDFAIMAGLAVYGMITGQQMGDDIARNSPGGSYRKAVAKYIETYKLIDNNMLFAYFEDWLEKYREKKLKKKIQNYLKDNGIHQMEVLDLDYKELDSLKEPYKKDWSDTECKGKYKNDITYFKSYTEDQINNIKECFEGKIKVSRINKSFFVDVAEVNDRDMWESASKATHKKNAYLSSNYFYKIIGILLTSIISAGLKPEKNEDVTVADVALSFARRIFTTVMAFIWGIYTGYELVKIDRGYLVFKETTLKNYLDEYNTKQYIPKSIEEEAKEEYEKQEAIKMENGIKIALLNNKEVELDDNSRTTREEKSEDHILE